MSDHGSPDGLGFDPLDDALGRALRDSAPETVDANATLTALRPRLVAARRRRRAAIAGASALAVLALGALAFTVPGGIGGSVDTPPANRPDGATTSTTTITPMPTEPMPTEPQGSKTVVPPGRSDPGSTTATTDDKGGSSGSSGGSGHGGSSGSSGSSGSGSSGSGGGD